MFYKNFFSVILIIILSIFVVNLTGCHYFKIKSRDDQYLKTKFTPPLKAPSGAGAENLGDDYVIPSVSYSENSLNKPVSKMPPRG